MLELIFASPSELFWNLSQESSRLRVRHCGKELDIKSEVKCIWSPMYFSSSAVILKSHWNFCL